jgi:hypothetical protein
LGAEFGAALVILAGNCGDYDSGPDEDETRLTRR